MNILFLCVILSVGITVVGSFPTPNYRFELSGTVQCISSSPHSFRLTFLEWDSSYWTNEATDEMKVLHVYEEKEIYTIFKYSLQHHYYSEDSFDETTSYILAYNITYNCPPNSGFIFYENHPQNDMRYGEELFFDLNKREVRKIHSWRARLEIAADSDYPEDTN